MGRLQGRSGHNLSAVRAAPSDTQALGVTIRCIPSQLIKALNQPVLVVSLGCMPKP